MPSIRGVPGRALLDLPLESRSAIKKGESFTIDVVRDPRRSCGAIGSCGSVIFRDDAEDFGGDVAMLNEGNFVVGVDGLLASRGACLGICEGPDPGFGC